MSLPSSKHYFMWLLLRKQNASDQVIPNYYGWELKIRVRVKEKLEKTGEVYLPPIKATITQFESIKKYIDHVTSLSNSASMPYVNILLDIGAAINAFKFIGTIQQHTAQKFFILEVSIL